MSRKHRFLRLFIAVFLMAALAVTFVACEQIIYEPDPSELENIPDPPPLPTPSEYTLHYEVAGGAPVQSKKLFEGELIPLSNITSKPGFTLEGWYEDAKCTVRLSIFTMPARDLYIYANWIENLPDIPVDPDKEYATIKFEVNGGSALADITAEVGSPISAPLSPTRPGYSFGGFYQDKGLNMPFEFTVMPEVNITVYVKWSPSRYTVSFVTGKDASVINPTLAMPGSKIYAPNVDPVRSGYRFVGWYADRQNNDGTIDVDLEQISFPIIVENKDIAIYAHWEAETRTVEFDLRGGKPAAGADYEPIVGAVGSSIAELQPLSPTRLGYEFMGWYTDSQGHNKFVFDKMPATNVKVYAVWRMLDKEVSVTLDSGRINGELYPLGDPAWEEVWASVTAKASANNDYSDFVAVNYTMEIKTLTITLTDGTVETLSDRATIDSLLTMNYEYKKLIKDAPTELILKFILDKDASIKYAGATFDVTVSMNAVSIETSGGIIDIANQEVAVEME